MRSLCTAILGLLVLSPAQAAPSGQEITARQDRRRILSLADNALKMVPVSITQNQSPLSEGRPNEFFSMSDYYWPDPAKPDGKPYIMRDGQSNPGNFNKHREALMDMRDATSALAAAYALTQDERYAKKAVQMLKVFFLDEETRMQPSLDHAQTIVGKPTPDRGTGLIDTLHLVEVPLAVLTLRNSTAMEPAIFENLRQWFADYTSWFATSGKGRNEAKARNNHAVAYWLQLAAFATLTEDIELLRECRRQFKEVFVPVQMAADGGFPLELGRTKPYAYSIFQLDNMAALCQLLSSESDNLWAFTTPDGRCMAKAVAFLYPYLADKTCWPLKPDIHAWEGWPVRQPALLFSGLAFHEDKYLKLWRELKPDPEDFEIRRNNAITQPLLWTTIFDHSGATPAPKKIRAQHVFEPNKKLIFEDDFQSGLLERWNISEDDRYALPAASPERIQVVDAPGLPDGAKAARFTVKRAPNSFRSEISLPHEDGFQERWYSARILIPEDWGFDPAKAHDIVMQWHSIPGNWQPTHPNLAISVSNDRWFIRQSFGSPQEGPTRRSEQLNERVRRGGWVSWVVHAKWSPKEDGLIQIWKDGKRVFDQAGPNVYGTIGVEYTPYMKTGIYHPVWHTDTDEKHQAFEAEIPVVTVKTVYVTDVIIGSERSALEDFIAPAQP
ncbi:polysaccharide lyase-like protein [Prosthecobacter fusiformis]|uniref:Polysaccharide lyase-like protein n=1 Tax=Prosthecobacter fusiformis TaxID=48464 RepID=A0A4R7S0E6_9BACT|nr:alginate lyase family protein [Prosthecobacter fusiformis]TDU71129.1 polysaccharide lyase-like protein [Prosthecobacter fusiformis]